MTSRRRAIAGVAAIGVLAFSAAVAVAAGPWRRAQVKALPDEAFAIVHVRPDGTRSRHLPHHDANGRVDLAHLRSALARLGQVRWEDPADAERARRHLQAHREALGVRRTQPGTADGADGSRR